MSVAQVRTYRTMPQPRAIGASNVAGAQAPARSPTRRAFPAKNECAADESSPASRLIERCHALLPERGEVSGAALATVALLAYRPLGQSNSDRLFGRVAPRRAAV